MNSNYPFLTQYNTISNNDSVLLTISELSDYLGIGKNTAYQLVRSNIIKGFRIGNKWKVSRNAVDLYIKEQSGL